MLIRTGDEELGAVYLFIPPTILMSEIAKSFVYRVRGSVVMANNMYNEPNWTTISKDTEEEEEQQQQKDWSRIQSVIGAFTKGPKLS